MKEHIKRSGRELALIGEEEYLSLETAGGPWVPGEHFRSPPFLLTFAKKPYKPINSPLKTL
uniref:Uncharacterized protein n=1 Tax=Anguilla anguilla TaxID=7936 RepID=A0A0E9QF56_ANGAN